MAFTFNQLPNGNVDVYQDGKHLSTGSADFAAATYGYNVAPPPTKTNTAGGIGSVDVPAPTPTNPTPTPTPSGTPPAPDTPAAPTPPTPPPPPTPPTPAAPAAPAAAPSSYQGPSIVDYLTSQGQPSDFASRATLAAQHGIDNYTGTAGQNAQLLDTIRNTTKTGSPMPGTNPSGITNGGQTPQSNTSPDGTPDPTDPYAGLDPIAKQVKMYTDASTALGLPTIKQKYDEIVKEQSDVTNEMNEKILDVQNNPWLSQGLVDKTSQKIKDSYQGKLETLTNLEKLYDSLYKTGQATVENIVSKANADVTAVNALAQKQADAAAALAKDNQVVSIGGREKLVNKVTGKEVADLGPSSTGAGTQTERTQATVDKIDALFITPGATIPGSPKGTDGKGIPFTDAEGFATPEGWKAALAASDIPRATFIKEFGHYIITPDGTVSSKYGLTPAEQKLIVGSSFIGY